MAARFFVNGGVDNLWTTIGNWSTTSGGAGGSSAPGGSDDVTFDTNSPNCTIPGTAARSALSITATNYTNQLTMSSAVTVGANITLGAGMQPILGNGYFQLNPSVSMTITSNGIAIPNIRLVGNGKTYVLADNLTVSGEFYINATLSSGVILNGNTLTILGYLNIYNTAMTGTTIINYKAPFGFYTLSGGTIANTLNITGATRGNVLN